MKIKRIHLQNYRGFTDRDFELHPEFTLVIGENGSGKSALLRACATVFQPNGNFNSNAPEIKESDVRILRLSNGTETRFERVFPVEIEATLEYAGRLIGERVRLLTPSDKRTDRGFANELQGLFKEASYDLKNTLPLLAYYRADRLNQSGARGMGASQDRSKMSRLAGLENSLDGSLAAATAINWLRREQFIALQEGKESLGFAAAREAMRKCLPKCRDVHYSVKEEALVIGFEDDTWRTFDSLSDGQKIILAMVADLATRAAWLNPALGERVLQETPGLVLIDELDLHLHPRWQRHVVEDLRRTFPRFQFVASTHSPFIIQSMRAGEVLNLDESPGISRSEYWNSGVEEIAEEEMGVEDARRSERYRRMLGAAEEYFRAALTPETDEIAHEEKVDEKLRKVLREFPDDPALEARLRLEAIAAKAGVSAELPSNSLGEQ